MDIKIQPRSKFIPYVPSSDPTQKIEDTTKLDIYFDVIKELKLHFKDIRPDIDQGRMQVAFSIPNFWNDGIPHTLLDDKALEWVWVYRTSNKSEFITTVVNGETVIMSARELRTLKKADKNA